MNSTTILFEKLKSFREPGPSGQTSEHNLFDYVRNTLGAVERLHIDFKEKRNRGIAKFEDDDLKNLAKAVSGFANSGGGVLLWGIEDKTLSTKPISNIQDFTANCLEKAPLLTDPVVSGIDGEWISSDSDPNSGYGIVHIPESPLPPHRVILNQSEIKNHYFIRSGSSFAVATHTQLEDMFGRRPKPHLSLSIQWDRGGIRGRNEYELYVTLGIVNNGRGVAKAPFLGIRVHPPYQIHKWGIDGNGNFGLQPLASTRNSSLHRYGSNADFIIHSGVTQEVTAVLVLINSEESQSNISDLVIDYQIAAEGLVHHPGLNFG